MSLRGRFWNGRTFFAAAALIVFAVATLAMTNLSRRGSASPAVPPPEAQVDRPITTSPQPAPAPAARHTTAAAVTDTPADTSQPDADQQRILVSTRKRMLWLVKGTDTIITAPVAVGMGKDFTFNGRRYHFATPKGTRRIIAKSPDPVWTVPTWHYYERAANQGLEAVQLTQDSKIELGDGSFIVVRGDSVGRINQRGYFAAFTPGFEIIFDGKIFIPPLRSSQRRVPNALGPYKLDMGDGYLIHGTHIYNEDSIGEAVSHGCVRMRNEELERLYQLVDRGTPVTIF